MGRVATGLLNLFLVYYFNLSDTYLFTIGISHLAFSIFWLFIIESEILIEKNHVIPSFIPATLDVTVVTCYCFLTGNIYSFLISTYVGLTAVSSVGENRIYGWYALTLSFIQYAAMGILVYFSILPCINIFSDNTAKINPGSLAFALTWMLATLYIVNNIVYRFVRSSAKLAIDAKIQKGKVEHLLRSYKKDLDMAKKIQSSLLPSNMNSIPQLKIDFKFLPMLEVGGDIYDIAHIEEGYIRIFLADATGHGVQAALITMVINTEYENLKMEFKKNPGELIDKLNESFVLKHKSLKAFFSCFILDVDLNAGYFHFASAGHPDQILINSGKLHFLKRTGRLIGFETKSEWYTETFSFQSKDKILLFTDGILEEYFVGSQKYGDEEFYRQIKINQHLSPEKLLNILIENAKFIHYNNEQLDDICLIAIEFSNNL